MGMSKDELKEMIDNTIFQNGNGQITGNGLNLVLNAIAENAGGNGGAGAVMVFNYNVEDYGQVIGEWNHAADEDAYPEFRPFREYNKKVFQQLKEKYLVYAEAIDNEEITDQLPEVIASMTVPVYLIDIYDLYNPGIGSWYLSYHTFYNGYAENGPESLYSKDYFVFYTSGNQFYPGLNLYETGFTANGSLPG